MFSFCFSSTLPLRCKLTGRRNKRQLVLRIKNSSFKGAGAPYGFACDAPYEKVWEEFGKLVFEPLSRLPNSLWFPAEREGWGRGRAGGWRGAGVVAGGERGEKSAGKNTTKPQPLAGAVPKGKSPGERRQPLSRPKIWIWIWTRIWIWNLRSPPSAPPSSHIPTQPTFLPNP